MYCRPFLNHRIPTSVVVVMLTLTLVIRGLLNAWRGCVIPSVNGTDCGVIRFLRLQTLTSLTVLTEGGLPAYVGTVKLKNTSYSQKNNILVCSPVD